MGKKNPVLHPYHGILLGNKKEPTIDSWNNLDEPGGNHAKQEKPISKGYVLLDSINVTVMK